MRLPLKLGVINLRGTGQELVNVRDGNHDECIVDFVTDAASGSTDDDDRNFTFSIGFFRFFGYQIEDGFMVGTSVLTGNEQVRMK